MTLCTPSIRLSRASNAAGGGPTGGGRRAAAGEQRLARRVVRQYPGGCVAADGPEILRALRGDGRDGHSGDEQRQDQAADRAEPGPWVVSQPAGGDQRAWT